MSTNPSKVYTVSNIAIVTRALMELVDSSYKSMIYNRNKYNMSEAAKHYRTALATVTELENLVGVDVVEADRACKFIRDAKANEYGA